MAAATQTAPLSIVDLIDNVPTDFDVARSHGFVSSTSAYMQTVVDLLTNFIDNSQQITKTQGDMSKNFCDTAKVVQTEVQNKWDEYYREKKQAEHSSFLTSILSYVMSALVGLIAAVSGNPALFAMSVAQIAMQASGGEKKLEDALPKQIGLKVLCELGIAVGAAVACGGINFGVENLVKDSAEMGAEDAASATVKTSTETAMGSVKNGAALLSQSLLMITPSFWSDALKATGLSNQAALYLGMAIGFAAVVGTGLIASDGAGLSGKIQQLFSKFSNNPELLQARLQSGLSFITAIFSGAAGGETIQTGVIQKEMADALRSVGVTQEKFSFLQGLMQMCEAASSQTQSATGAFTQDLSEVTETFRAFADMFRQPN